jgi:hypothetical protein
LVVRVGQVSVPASEVSQITLPAAAVVVFTVGGTEITTRYLWAFPAWVASVAVERDLLRLAVGRTRVQVMVNLTPVAVAVELARRLTFLHMVVPVVLVL